MKKLDLKGSSSLQTTMDAFVQEKKVAKTDTGANVNAMTLNSLVSDLVTCSNCKREWDGYAQCPCWYDDCDGENDKNEINNLKCDEQLSESDEE